MPITWPVIGIFSGYPQAALGSDTQPALARRVRRAHQELAACT
jgi:hypothetical protein